MNRGSWEGASGSETSLRDPLMRDTCYYTHLSKPMECTTPRVTLMSTTDSGSQWHAVCAHQLYQMHHLKRMPIAGEAVHACGQGECEDSQDVPLNFAVNLKLLWKKNKSLKKKNPFYYLWKRWCTLKNVAPYPATSHVRNQISWFTLFTHSTDSNVYDVWWTLSAKDTTQKIFNPPSHTWKGNWA